MPAAACARPAWWADRGLKPQQRHPSPPAWQQCPTHTPPHITHTTQFTHHTSLSFSFTPPPWPCPSRCAPGGPSTAAVAAAGGKARTKVGHRSGGVTGGGCRWAGTGAALTSIAALLAAQAQRARQAGCGPAQPPRRAPGECRCGGSPGALGSTTMVDALATFSAPTVCSERVGSQRWRHAAAVALAAGRSACRAGHRAPVQRPAEQVARRQRRPNRARAALQAGSLAGRQAGRHPLPPRSCAPAAAAPGRR